MTKALLQAQTLSFLSDALSDDVTTLGVTHPRIFNLVYL